mmetsp:Transcript_114810/g.223014  ORF Transcript_114810/g.223014 Transcript_114810/m.223014 type:complete len:246 (+) Transcript_114810:587-1324(+)
MKDRVASLKILLAWSSERILIAATMPCNSSVRIRQRVDHTDAASLQETLVSAKKTSSAFNCAMVSSRSVLLSECNLFFSPIAFSCLCKVACNVFNSAFLVAINVSKAFCFWPSSPFDFSTSATNASYMLFKIPWIWLDCGAKSPKGLLPTCSRFRPLPEPYETTASGWLMKRRMACTSSAGVLSSTALFCSTCSMSAAMLCSCASRMVSRRPAFLSFFAAPAPVRTVIADSKAPMHCSFSARSLL